MTRKNKPYPDQVEVQRLWDESGSVAYAVPVVSEYLKGRGLDVEAMARQDACRVLTSASAYSLPSWAKYRAKNGAMTDWYAGGYRLLVPMVDSRGVIRSLRAHQCIAPPKNQPKPPKSRAAAGRGGGLMMAGARARAELASDYPISDFVIVEGEPDLWAWATLGRDWPIVDGVEVALGMYSGGWPQSMPATIGPRAQVRIYTDHDAAGDRYAAVIGRSLPGRKLWRSVVSDLDLCEIVAVGEQEPPELDQYIPPRENKKQTSSLNFDPDRSDADRLKWARAAVWGSKKSTGIIGKLNDSVKGDHNRAIYRAARAAAKFCNFGPLDRSEVEADIISAGVALGHDRDRASSACASGFGDGEGESFEMPPKDKPDHRLRRSPAPSPAEQEKESTSPASPSKTKSSTWTKRYTDHVHEINSAPWTFSPSETDLADRLIELYSVPGEEPPVACEGNLWLFHPPTGIYQEVSEQKQKRHLRAWNGRRYSEANAKRISLAAKHYKNALALVLDFQQRDGFFDAAPHGIAVKNGFLRIDLKTQTVDLEPLTAEHRARWRLDCEYDPRARGKMLETYLGSVHAITPKERAAMEKEGKRHDEHQRLHLMGELMASALFGLGPHYNKAALILGKSGCGKSTFVELLSAVVPAQGRVELPLHDLDDENKALLAMGKTLIFDTEIDDKMNNEAAFKKTVSGEPQTHRPAFGIPICYRTRALLAYAGECVPRFKAPTRGLWDRWLALRFDVRFRGSRSQVVNIGQHIAEHELAAVLAWAVKSARRLIAHGSYTHVPSSDSVFAEWRMASDTVEEFITERCTILDDDAPICDGDRVASLFTAYREWCGNGGYCAVNRRNFKTRACRVKGVRSGKASTCRLSATLDADPSPF